MLRRTRTAGFRMKLGQMYVDYTLQSRDTRRSLRIEEALVDPGRDHSTAPLSWLEALRSPSPRLPTGFFTEEPTFVPPPKFTGKVTGTETANAVKAGPLMMHILGMPMPVVVDMRFVDDAEWGMAAGQRDGIDLRVGRDAIEQCPLFQELRPGGLLSDTPLSALRDEGLLQCGLAESPLARRPWTRMKTMFVDELQRGPMQKEFVGNNPRNGKAWRFSQHCKLFRLGIFRETVRRNDFVEGLQGHSSFQRSPQQAVPEVRFLAPGP